MKRRKSDKTKIKEKYGQGVGSEYRSFIEPGDFSSLGTCTTAIDWITKRTVILLSQVEYKVWLMLRWSDKVVDIQEQYPLDIDVTQEIAETFGLKHASDNGKPLYMTTDFLVTLKGGNQVAVYVKPDKNDWKKTRGTRGKIFIEKFYWTKYKGIQFVIVSNEDINNILCRNIETVTEYYDPVWVHDKKSLLCHKIARKEIKVDMETRLLDLNQLLKEGETYEQEQFYN